MTAIEIYEILSKLLAQKANSMRITKDELEKYNIPEGWIFRQSYLERLASSLQNSGMMHNSIRFNESEERYLHIKNVLCDFDCGQVLAKYGNWQALYNGLTRDGALDRGKQKETNEKKTNWGKYAKGLFCGVEFLAKENGTCEIEALCKPPTTEEELNAKIKKIKNIEDRIHGLGFALTCDWLKECGCTWLAKPDIHIKVVCSAIAGKGEESRMSDVEIIKFMFHFAADVQKKYPDVTAYQIDKMIWLICTGNFYLQKDKTGRDTILSMIKG